MKDKPIVWYTKLRADIFCKDFCEQLHLENIKLPPDDPSFYYDLGIIVNSINVYNVDKIRQYLFDHGSYRSLGDLYEEFDDILRQQFKPVYEAFKAFGYRFGSAFICALGSGDPDEVTILLLRGQDKEYDKKGKLKKIITVSSAIPNGVGFSNLLSEFLSAKKSASVAAKSKDQIVPEFDHPQEQTIPPLSSEPQITLSELFNAIVVGVAEKTNIRASITNELTAKYRIVNNDPLLIESTYSEEIQSNPMTSAVTYPQWFLYCEMKDHTWNISAFPSGPELQRKLLDICKQKSTYIAVPFHNLTPISYTLSAKLFMGYTKINFAEASRYSDVQIMWDDLIKT